MSELEKIREWVNESSDYLSQSTDYARGYKDGIIRAKYIVQSLLENKDLCF